MKRFLVLLLMLTLTAPFFAGCDKKAEVKQQTTTTTPEGTTTQTDTHKVETDKK
jgi:hypothetical protein